VRDDVRGRPDRSMTRGSSLATLNGTAAGPARWNKADGLAGIGSELLPTLVHGCSQYV